MKRRMSSGEEYAYISMVRKGVLHFKEQYWGMDDHHYESENYFCSDERARKCLEDVYKHFEKRKDKRVIYSTEKEAFFVNEYFEVEKMYSDENIRKTRFDLGNYFVNFKRALKVSEEVKIIAEKHREVNNENNDI